MTRLKRWESPRKSGRNDKGRGGSARQRQLRKRDQVLRQQLKQNKKKESGSREVNDLSFLLNVETQDFSSQQIFRLNYLEASSSQSAIASASVSAKAC